jgi:hypothetical protein
LNPVFPGGVRLQLQPRPTLLPPLPPDPPSDAEAGPSVRPRILLKSEKGTVRKTYLDFSKMSEKTKVIEKKVKTRIFFSRFLLFFMHFPRKKNLHVE